MLITATSGMPKSALSLYTAILILSSQFFVFFRIFLVMLPIEVNTVKFWKTVLLFLIGGSGYVGLELLWRGRSHVSMFLAGGVCFLLLGKLNRVKPRLPLLLRGLLGALTITSVELLAGLLANRDYRVWDYRNMPLNFYGQVCLPFSLLWVPLSLGAMALYRLLERYVVKPPESL